MFDDHHDDDEDDDVVTKLSFWYKIINKIYSLGLCDLMQPPLVELMAIFFYNFVVVVVEIVSNIDITLKTFSTNIINSRMIVVQCIG